MNNKIKVAIIGVTGYAGQEILRFLLNHPYVEIHTIISHSYAGKKISEIYGNFKGICDIVCSEEMNLEALSKQVDVIFLSLPHGIASGMVTNEVLLNCKVIDLGPDFRIKDVNEYEKWYKVKHNGISVLPSAVYGLAEIDREEIVNAKLVANPGCYATCAILSIYPLIKEGIIDINSIIIDAKSGVTGAGRNATVDSLFCEVNETMKAYKTASHRHIPEIESIINEYTSAKNFHLVFNPHLIPIERGIYVDAYAKLNKNLTALEIIDIFKKYYGNEKFVRIYDENTTPEVRWIKCSNYYDVGIKVDSRTNSVIVIGTLDNLVKGAAGQAIQNMNLMFGFDEDAGINSIGIQL